MINENQIYDNYLTGITKIGRATMLLGMLATLLPALLMTFYFGYNPGISAIIAGAVCQISVSGAFWFSEPISYYPIIGRAGLYMAFLSGNTVNVRIPAAISAQQASGHTSGTNKGSIYHGNCRYGSFCMGLCYSSYFIYYCRRSYSFKSSSFIYDSFKSYHTCSFWRNIYSVCYKISKNWSFCSCSMLHYDAGC